MISISGEIKGIFWHQRVEFESLKPSKVINAVTAIKFSLSCCFFLGPWYSSTLVDLWLFVLSRILRWKQLHLYQSLLLLLCRNPDRVFFYLFLLRVGKECSIWYSNKEKKLWWSRGTQVSAREMDKALRIIHHLCQVQMKPDAWPFLPDRRSPRLWQVFSISAPLNQTLGQHMTNITGLLIGTYWALRLLQTVSGKCH